MLKLYQFSHQQLNVILHTKSPMFQRSRYDDSTYSWGYGDKMGIKGIRPVRGF